MRLAVVLLTSGACASQSDGCQYQARLPGEVLARCVCGGYQGAQLCAAQGGYDTCDEACSGGACCDPGFAPTAVDENVVAPSLKCRPGPAGMSATLCCPSAMASNCPVHCASAADCPKKTVCCDGACAAAPCLGPQFCTTSAECGAGRACFPSADYDPNLLCMDGCTTASDCPSGQVCCVWSAPRGECSSPGCAQQCLSSDECPSGEMCQPSVGISPPIMVCTSSLDAGSGE